MVAYYPLTLAPAHCIGIWSVRVYAPWQVYTCTTQYNMILCKYTWVNVHSYPHHGNPTTKYPIVRSVIIIKTATLYATSKHQHDDDASYLYIIIITVCVFAPIIQGQYGICRGTVHILRFHWFCKINGNAQKLSHTISTFETRSHKSGRIRWFR
jgi:hypothetical protein